MKVKSIYIQRMITAIDTIFLYLGDMTIYDFENSGIVHDAVLMQFQHLWETANKLKSAFPDEDRIPILDIIAFRNLVAHEYLGIESARVYLIAHEALPELRQTLSSLL